MEQVQISKDMTIGEVITKYPSTVEVLLRNGIHCVGCGANTFETIEGGLKGHGASDEQVEKILKEMADSVEIVEGEEVNITTKAVTKLKEILKQENKAGYGLRVSVMPGGCAGFQYGFDFENESQDGDTVLEKDGVAFYVDEQSMKMLKGATIEYVESLQGAGFRISNPNATSGCGCGKSFA